MKINEKIKSYIAYATKQSQEHIGLLQKATDVVLELDKHNLEASYIKEKPYKVIISIGKYNLVVQDLRESKVLYLLFNFETKERLLSTENFDELKNKLGEISL
jgi:hypothetical protein